MPGALILCPFYSILKELKRPFTNLLQRNWKTLHKYANLSLVNSAKNPPKIRKIIGDFVSLASYSNIRYNNLEFLWTIWIFS